MSTAMSSTPQEIATGGIDQECRPRQSQRADTVHRWNQPCSSGRPSQSANIISMASAPGLDHVVTGYLTIADWWLFRLSGCPGRAHSAGSVIFSDVECGEAAGGVETMWALHAEGSRKRRHTGFSPGMPQPTALAGRSRKQDCSHRSDPMPLPAVVSDNALNPG